ncbi:hypothetical protein LTR57_010985 [Friedmanniomyces endolithicus]|nr:hypothetical protein LTR57_010985 [Friedmanniomyces endolithicus]
MSLSAFFPFYRNHNVKATISQEAYRWSSVAEASRRAMSVRYSLLTYMANRQLHSFVRPRYPHSPSTPRAPVYYAHTQGDTVMRALAWEFPNDPSLAGTFTQFMLGPSLLITPVLIPNVESVNGVFPGIGEGTNWYDWYTLQPVVAQAYENVTLSAPITHINVHIRGGAILPLQAPAYTTAETRANPYSLLVALDESGQASGSLYLDDGESLVQDATKLVQFSYTNNCLSTTINGTYHAAPPLANVTVAGAPSLPKGMSLTIAGQPCEVSKVALDYSGGVLYVSGIEPFTPGGAWEGEMRMEFSY